MSEPRNPVRDLLDRALGLPAANGASDEALLARVRVRLMDAVRQGAAQQLTVPPSPDGWAQVAEGVHVKVLWCAEGMQSCLVRLAPGAVFPAHAHSRAEECVVLEGSLRIGADIHLRRGDYHLAMPGSLHGIATSEAGTVVFLRKAEQA